MFVNVFVKLYTRNQSNNKIVIYFFFLSEIYVKNYNFVNLCSIFVINISNESYSIVDYIYV